MTTHGPGRRKPYSASGISRVPCIRCGKPGWHQWQICADKRVYRVLCLDCDLALNRLVLEWAGFPDADEKMAAYERKFA